MAKSFKGYTGKLSTKIGVGVGALLLAGGIITGGTILSRLSNRPDNNADLENNKETGIHTPVISPDITPEKPGYEDYTVELVLPELNEPMIPETDQVVEDLGVKFTEVLAKLTNLSKKYIKESHNLESEPNVTIMGLTSIQANSSTGDVVLLGQANVNGKLSNFIATINNTNSSLDIFNLSNKVVTEDEFVGALNHLLDDEYTVFQLTLKQHTSLSNEEEVISDILNNRLEDLNSSGLSDQNTLDEIAHITQLLQQNNLKLNVLLNNRTKSENVYLYSFTICVNTGTYVYSADMAFESEYVLSSTSIKQNIEDYLEVNNIYPVNSATSSAINSALYLINGEIFNSEKISKNNLEPNSDLQQ